MKKVLFLSLPAIVLVLTFSCKNEQTQSFDEEQYRKDYQRWKAERLQKLKSEDGWLNLIGLYWLKEGINLFGSGDENDIIFPEDTPKEIGAIIEFKKSLSLSINKGINVTVNDSLISDYNIRTDAEKNTSFFKLGHYKWHIIDRNGTYGVRLRDLENPNSDQLKEIPSYPLNIDWRVEAEYKPYANPKTLMIENAVGMTEPEFCYGSLNFKIGDKDYELLPLGDGSKEDLFLMFADKSSSRETYEAGRYLSVSKPDSSGKTIIDFNKAVNPPCAFTAYATCPRPPIENILDLEVTAGEKKVDHPKTDK